LEVSIRLIAWTVAFQFFRNSATFRRSAAAGFLKSLWQQADFLSSNLQPATTPGVVPNNHLIAELTGLALVGAAFPEFREAAAWRDTSLALLDREVPARTASTRSRPLAIIASWPSSCSCS
jgi:heparan-sulfate lyase